MYFFADVRGGKFEQYGTGLYIQADTLADAEIEAGLQLAIQQDWPVYEGTYVRNLREIETYPVPFLCGDGTDAIMLDVVYAAGGSAGLELVGYDSTCAFCHGDPCAETSAPDTKIGAYFARNKWAETCPCCDGRPS